MSASAERAPAAEAPGAPQVALIAAVAENGVIGREGDLPFRLPTDFRYFKSVTLGHTLIMGRRTHLSIGRPLPGRRTIVVSREVFDGVDHAPSVVAALAMADRPVFFAGGTGIYAEGLNHADTLYLTRVHAAPEGDTRFPDFTGHGFKLTQSTPGNRTERDEYDFTFEVWRR